VSYTCPFSLLTAPAATQGTWDQNGNTVVLAVPAGQQPGSYHGFLQYSVIG